MKAIFEKPDIKKLNKQGYTCIDMHCHSRYSDGLQKIDALYKRCKKLGIGIALTDHNEIKGVLKLSRYKDLKVIPGIETTSSEGIHTLFYFYDIKELQKFYNALIKPNLGQNPFSDLKINIIDLVEKGSKYKCLISTAHPFAPGHTGLHKFMDKKEYRKILKKIDCMEVINGGNFHFNNVKGLKWAKSIGKIYTGGTDAHMLTSVGRVITAVKGKNFLDGLKKNSLVIGKESSFPILCVGVASKFKMLSGQPKIYIKKAINYLSK